MVLASWAMIVIVDGGIHFYGIVYDVAELLIAMLQGGAQATFSR